MFGFVVLFKFNNTVLDPDQVAFSHQVSEHA